MAPVPPDRALGEELADLLEDPEAARVGEAQGVVEHVAVAVEALRGLRELHDGIGREETPEFRVVDPAVHVDQAQLVQVLVAGEAARRLQRHDERFGRLPVGLAPLAVGVERQALGLGASLVGDDVDRAQVVALVSPRRHSGTQNQRTTRRANGNDGRRFGRCARDDPTGLSRTSRARLAQRHWPHGQPEPPRQDPIVFNALCADLNFKNYL